MKKILVLVLLASAFTAPAIAADPAAGKAKAAVCAACHGVDGIAVIPGYPNLKGQNEQYLINAMKAYKNKERTGGMAMVMQPQASMLNDADIANVAAYFAQMK